MVRTTMWKALLATLPRGYTVSDVDWQRRHRLLLRLLAAHIPALAVVGALLDRGTPAVLAAVASPLLCVVLGRALRGHRRTAAVLVTFGFVSSSVALVGLTGGAIEAHFHFFIIIGFVALYQDWAPFLFMILFTTVSHGVGSIWQRTMIFEHSAGQVNPWLWSLIHGVAVLLACVGTVLFWRIMEESQQEKDALTRRLADADAQAERRQFTSDLLVNLARRNQSVLYRQLDIINQLEESERDPATLAELFTLDHLATRVRRNAESLLVLSGEQPPHSWSLPVPLRDVLRAAIAETEDRARVVFVVDEKLAVGGHTASDLTHMIAELIENAVRFSPPDSTVTVRARPDPRRTGGQVLSIEDWGVGMPTAELAAANALLAEAQDVDLSVSHHLGLPVVAKLAARHDVEVSLSATPGSGVTAVLALPAGLFVGLPAATAPLPMQLDAAGRTDGPADLPRIPDLPQATQPISIIREGAGSREGAGARAPHAGDAAPVAGLPGLEIGPVDVGAVGVTAAGMPDGVSASGSRGSNGGQQSWLGWWEPEIEGDRESAVFAVPSPRPTSAPDPFVTPFAAPPVPSQAAFPAVAAGTAAVNSPATGVGNAAAARVERPPVDPAIGLRRRVPQAHLAPELRDPVGPEPVRQVVPSQMSDAASALSRYQASRQAARTAVDSDSGRTS